MSIGNNSAKISFAPHHFSDNKSQDNSKTVNGKNEEMVWGYFLGIDYGKSNVGLALADSETKMAFAHKSFKNDKNLKENLAEIVEEENVGKAIIGIPSYENGETIEEEAKRLGEFLQNSLKIEVFYQNEMFTTKMAQANLKEGGFKNISKSDDRESARIILQEWLDNS